MRAVARSFHERDRTGTGPVKALRAHRARATGHGPGTIENSLLAAVPRKEYRRLLAGLEAVSLTFGEVLYEPGETIRHVYFPNKSLISLLTLADGHLALEVGLIGREGMVGHSLGAGPRRVSVRALVQGSGWPCAWRRALSQGIPAEPAACSASCTATSTA